MAEINLLDQYPRSQRPVEDRAKLLTKAHRQIANQFGKEYFDGDRLYGYGGYHYHPRFWQATVKRFRDYYNLAEDAAVLDVGCAKGFMLYDFKELMPNMTIAGLDISEYALANASEDVKPFLKQGNAKELPYADNSFDLIISINTVHYLPLEECKQALREIQRVTRHYAFVVVDAWRNQAQKEKLMQWNINGLTYMHVDDWVKLLDKIGYRGDYYWFIAE